MVINFVDPIKCKILKRNGINEDCTEAALKLKRIIPTQFVACPPNEYNGQIIQERKKFRSPFV